MDSLTQDGLTHAGRVFRVHGLTHAGYPCRTALLMDGLTRAGYPCRTALPMITTRDVSRLIGLVYGYRSSYYQLTTRSLPPTAHRV